MHGVAVDIARTSRVCFTSNVGDSSQHQHKRIAQCRTPEVSVNADAHMFLSTDLTWGDVEWDLVADMLERASGQRGAQVRYRSWS